MMEHNSSMPLTHTIWTRKSPTFPEHAEYMEILPHAGVIMCANVASVDPVRHYPMALYYVEVRDGLIRTRLSPDRPWKEDTYRIERDLIVWNHDGKKEWPWKMISQDQLPEWYAAFVEKAQARMNERAAAIRDSQSKDLPDADNA
jgi:hypothetical protein